MNNHAIRWDAQERLRKIGEEIDTLAQSAMIREIIGMFALSNQIKECQQIISYVGSKMTVGDSDYIKEFVSLSSTIDSALKMSPTSNNGTNIENHFAALDFKNIKLVHEEMLKITRLESDEEAIVSAFHFQRYYAKAIKNDTLCTSYSAIDTALKNVRHWMGNEDSKTAARINFLWGNIPV